MIDRILSSETHWWFFFAGTIVFFLLMVEGGYWVGRWRREHTDPEQKSQTGTILAALLALLGFLLAISFGIAADRFAERKALVLQEANDIGTTFLRTNFLPQAQGDTSKTLLAAYVDTRLRPLETADVDAAIHDSVELQSALWEQATIAAAAHPRSVPVGLYIDSLNDVIDRHEERVTVAIHYRIPPSLIWTLYLVALLSMVVMGLNFGLAGTRNMLASVALVMAFSAVLLLIVDLDQVHQRLFTVSQSPLEDTQASIQKTMAEGHGVGGGPHEESE
ncbi:hypothetical protein EA187_19505 [Lujinxingia sediminis]|uniref:DUF4239 domain-containing protein n=1 Tax=Lujinxingia sediminis TaxID=2480984 RepID=A0ABY0CMT7_9DELT|nr:hypothetical protein [Lujinxingia sediminis]RVU40969.1 hypothetical protein EA187_19505 [Lujinxingia sediminis]